LRCSRYCDTGSRARRKPDRVSWWTWFSSRRMVLCNFKSANHVRFFQPDNTLNPEEPIFILFLLYRRITSLGKLTITFWIGVLAVIGWILVEGAWRFNPAVA